jgi:hypothetical protein
LFEKALAGLRGWVHKREIEAAVEHFAQRTGQDARKKHAFSESGSFQSQLQRLFTLGSAEETGELKTIASTAVNLCISNKYYRPADFLSDIIDDLERRTFLSMEAEGEAPLEELDSRGRKLKIEHVMKGWLVPLKVASVESLLIQLARDKGRSLPYVALGRFERQTARVFSLIGESDVRFVEQHFSAFLQSWTTEARLKQRFPEPADGAKDVYQCLTGEIHPEGTDSLRLRGPGKPFRLSTLVPEDRQHLVSAALERIR